MEDKLKNIFGDMLVYKSPSSAKIFSVRNLPSFMRDWLVMRFADANGKIDTADISRYIEKIFPKLNSGIVIWSIYCTVINLRDFWLR